MHNSPHGRHLFMKIILDTDQKTIILPWNYAQKLSDLNRLIREYGGSDAQEKTFLGFIDECWRYAIEHNDEHVKTAEKPVRGKR